MFVVIIEELHNICNVLLQVLGLLDLLDLLWLCYQSAKSHQHLLKLIIVITTIVYLSKGLKLLVPTRSLLRLNRLEVWACLVVITLSVESHILFHLNIVMDLGESCLQDGSLDACAFWNTRPYHLGRHVTYRVIILRIKDGLLVQRLLPQILSPAVLFLSFSHACVKL